MKKILLICNAGMSTSMLVKKLQESAQAQGLDLEVEAQSLTEAKKHLQDYQVILLGPQIRYELANVTAAANGLPVAAIDMRDYGMMNGPKVLAQALELLGD